MRVKLAFLGSFYKNLEIENAEEMVTVINKVKKANKDFQNIKIKSTQQIVAFKKIERDINNLYESFKGTMVEYKNNSGFAYLSELINKPEFHCLRINDINPEELNRSFGDDSTMSDAILFKFNEHDQQEILPIVNNGFVSSDFCGQRYYNADEPDALNSETGYMESVFLFPDLTVCTANELKILRKLLAQPGMEFRQKINAWINLCKTAADHSESINFFMQQVKPAAQNIITLIEQNQHFNSLRIASQNKHTRFKVMFGETALQHLWNYYKFKGIFKDATWQKLTAFAESNPEILKRRIPIMCVNTIFSDETGVTQLLKAEEDIMEETTLPVKKSISID